MSTHIKIGELAKRTCHAPSKIRFYENIGLLPMVTRSTNGYRTYPPEAETMLHLISSGQNAGFSLTELKALLPANLDHWQHDALVSALQQKIHDIEAMERTLADNKARLLGVLTDIQNKPDSIDCTSNARQVISQLLTPDSTRPPNDD